MSGLFDYHLKGECGFDNSYSVLRMRIEKRELSWSDLRFESKRQINQLFDAWCLKAIGLLGLLGLTKRMY